VRAPDHATTGVDTEGRVWDDPALTGLDGGIVGRFRGLAGWGFNRIVLAWMLAAIGAILLVSASSASTAAGSAGTIRTVVGDPVGSGPATQTAQVPAAIAVAPGGGSLYVADSSVSAVREVAADGHETVVAGDGIAGLSGAGGPATQAELTDPTAVATDRGGDLLIGEHNYVQLVAAASCSSDCPYGLTTMTEGSIYPIAGDGFGGTTVVTTGTPATSIRVNTGALAVDAAGNLLLTDGFQVQVLAAANCASACPYGLSTMTAGDIYPVAGNGSSGTTGVGGPALDAEELTLGGIAVDSSGDVLITDTGADEIQLVAAANCSSGCPFGLTATTAGDLYTIAGDGSPGFSGDGRPATLATLDQPQAVAVEAGTTLVIADAGNARVRIVNAAGEISTIAGTGTRGATGDGGAATAAELNQPDAVATDGSGDILIGDEGADRVRLLAGGSCSSACAYGLPALDD
jgi:hypothetical protein